MLLQLDIVEAGKIAETARTQDNLFINFFIEV